MDRIKIQCLISGQPTNLQLDKKAMPGEKGPCYMVTADCSFKGYISEQKNGSYQHIGSSYFTDQDLLAISDYLKQ